MAAEETQIGGNHYASKKIQPWQAMEAWMSREQFTGFLRGNAIKYLARCEEKGGVEDLKKAKHYLEKLIEFREGIGVEHDANAVDLVPQGGDLSNSTGGLKVGGDLPPTPLKIAEWLRLLVDEMDGISVVMDYYGGFSEWAQHGREIAGAGAIARRWADEIEAAIALDEVELRRQE